MVRDAGFLTPYLERRGVHVLRVGLASVGVLACGTAAAQVAQPTAAGTVAAASALGRPAQSANGEQGVDWRVRVGATYSDNIQELQTGGKSDTIATTGLQLSIFELKPRLTLDVVTDAEYDHYVNSGFSNQLVGALSGLAAAHIVPDRLDFVVQENVGQARQNALAIDTPGNRQIINYFTAGPDWTIPLPAATDIRVQGRWSAESFQISPLDSTRLFGAIALERRLSRVTSISLNLTSQHVVYQQSPPNIDYSQQAAFVGLTAGGPRTSMQMQLGYVDVRQLGKTEGSPLAALVFSRRLSPLATVTLTAGIHTGDSADNLRREQGFTGPTLGSVSVLAASGPYRTKFAGVAWEFTGPRYSATLRADFSEEVHRNAAALDRQISSAGLTLTRIMSQRLRIGIAGIYGREDFSVAGTKFNTGSADGFADWSLTRNLNLSAHAGSYRGTGDGLHTYRENRATLSIEYGRGR